jgi:hypothetical protein
LAAVLSLLQGQRFSASAVMMTLESTAWIRGVEHYFTLLDPAGDASPESQ